MTKRLTAMALLLISLVTTANAKNHDINLGKIKHFTLIVSCPSNYNQGEVNAASIIESFEIVGSNEKLRYKTSGCQFNQSYPLFVEGNELRMWVKWIDGSPSDENRYNEMRKHGSILLGTLDDVRLPTCDGPGFKWFNKLKVAAVDDLKITEQIRLISRGSHSHNMKISNTEHSIETVGWITKKARASEREESTCFFKK